ncbi:hypothetical protein DFH09DRAFT_1286648 [Mycena vulgaris]|nr:hypothetical protein DFH09DRAFT_1286648 [Mycena vulgaris]
MSAPPICLEANPDISGLGVRISFYVQTIALVLLAGRSLEEALNSVTTLLGTSFGLTISALVTLGQNQLPLYQAIIVTDLIWLANFAIFMALATYNRHPRGSHVVQYAGILQTCVSVSCMLYLWARAPALEFNGHAGQTMFVVFFVSRSATGVGRMIALVVTSSLFLGYSFVAGRFIQRRFTLHHHHIEYIPVQTQGASALPSDINVNNAAPVGHRQPPSLPLDPHLIILSCVFSVPYIITLICTEMQIDRNRLCSGNSSWGFGQILAMTVTIVPVVTTVQAFRKYGWRQRPRATSENAQG